MIISQHVVIYKKLFCGTECACINTNKNNKGSNFKISIINEKLKIKIIR